MYNLISLLAIITGPFIEISNVEHHLDDDDDLPRWQERHRLLKQNILKSKLYFLVEPYIYIYYFIVYILSLETAIIRSTLMVWTSNSRAENHLRTNIIQYRDIKLKKTKRN